MTKKWIEINIFPAEKIATLKFMRDCIFPLVDKIQRDYSLESWHYFLEGGSVRLRFLSGEHVTIRMMLEVEAGLMQERGKVEKFFFGRHGVKGEDYEGEEDFWGKKQWPVAMRMYRNGSEVAKSLMELNIEPFEMRKHAERYIHLLLNQLGYGYYSEASFYLAQYHDAFLMVIRGMVDERLQNKNGT